MRDVVGGEAAELQGYRLEPVGPWRVRVAPFPFAESPAHFSLLRRVLPKDGGVDVLARSRRTRLTASSDRASPARFASRRLPTDEPVHCAEPCAAPGTSQSSRIAAARTGEP